MTEPGRQIIALARGVLREADRVKTTAKEFVGGDGGVLTLAATYTLARYALLGVYQRFVARYPRVELRLLQGSPDLVSKMAATGEVDITVTTRHTAPASEGLLIDYCDLPRVLLAPHGHPLLRRKPITLSAIAEHPLIRLGRRRMREVFAQSALTPKVIFTDLEIDVDVVKALVGAGLGVAILAEIAYNARRDTNLRAMRVGHIFEPHICSLAIRRNHYLRGYMYDFIHLLALQLDRQALDNARATAGAA